MAATEARRCHQRDAGLPTPGASAGGCRCSRRRSRLSLKNAGSELASPIFVVARAMPMVRMKNPMRLFCSAKKFSTRECDAGRRDQTDKALTGLLRAARAW
jgi:hypothetical protein